MGALGEKRWDFESLGRRVLARVKPMLWQGGQLSVVARSQIIAVCNWLGKYRPPAEASEKEKVRGFLEAVYHCCKGGAGEVAEIILLVCVDEANETTFVEQLGKWGLYAEQIEVCQWMLSLGDGEERRYLSILGRAHYTIGEFDAAREYYERCLRAANLEGSLLGQMVAVNGLALVKGAIGDFEGAVVLHRRQLAIAEKLEDEKAVGAAWGDIGRVHQFRGEYEAAVACHERYLESSQGCGDVQGQAIALDNLGLAHRALGRWKKALSFHQQGLALAQTKYDAAGSWGNLGLVQLGWGKYEEAILCFERHREICQEIGNRQGEAKA